MENIILLVLRVVCAVLGIVIVRYIVPWLCSKTGAAGQETLRGIVKAAVEAAEQTITGSGRGTEKKAWVIDYLKDAGVITDTNEKYVDAIIEAMVYGLNAENAAKG